MRPLPLLVTLLCLATAPAAFAEGPRMPQDRQIAISAVGNVAAKPDQAEISIGVSNTAKTAKAALAANTAAMTDVIASIKAAGVEPRDIQTASFSVQPAYEYSNDGKPPKLTGYSVTNGVTARLRDVSRIGDVLDRVVDKGSNQISGIQFIVSKAEELKDAARKVAVANATRMAKTYAEAAGVTLGDVLLISEGAAAGEPRGPFLDRASLRQKNAAPPPVEAGEVQLEAQVNMVWAIK